jgi:Uma2 family endonuclease
VSPLLCSDQLVPDTMAITQRRHTFADLLALEPEAEHFYEILGGELVVFSSPNEPHAAVVAELFHLLIDAQRAGFGRARTAPRAVAFDYEERGLESVDVTLHDLFFVREGRREILGHRCVEGAPDLVIEILSPSTRALDLPGGAKWSIYERYGVPYYWIVDLDARTLTQYEWSAGRYGAPTVLRSGDTLQCPLFPGITRDLASVFAGIL